MGSRLKQQMKSTLIIHKAGECGWIGTTLQEIIRRHCAFCGIQFVNTVKRLIFNSAPQPSDINENAVEKVEEVQEALRSVDAGDVGYGYYSTEVIIAERNYERACLYAKAVEDVFKSQMMKPKIEDVGAVDAWLGSLPRNFHHYCRRIYASTGNLIHMMPLSDIWSGQRRNKHLDGPALLYTRSDGATPFRMNLHVGDVGPLS